MADYSDYENNNRLIEQKGVSQNAGEPFRKIYFARQCDLIFWYGDDSCREIEGVQITLTDSHVITALKDKPISFTSTDTNDKFYRAAILKANGVADTVKVEEILSPLLKQLPEMESRYAAGVVGEIKKGNYVRYPITN